MQAFTVLWILSCYCILSAAMTWPLLGAELGSIGGNDLDAVQTLWGFWYLNRQLDLGLSPFFCDLLWWPDGVPMWFQTWDLPGALVVRGLRHAVPITVAHNLTLFLSFPLSALACCLLIRELWGGVVGPFLAGCIYALSPFHFATATANLHIAEMQWSAVYFWAIVRSVKRRGLISPAIAGIALALATLASPYHLVFCAIGTVVLAAGHWAVRTRDIMLAFAKQFVVMVASFVVLTGWLIGPMVRHYVAEPYSGAHDAQAFSIDVQSLFLLNGISAWSSPGGPWTHWRSPEWAGVGYLGYTAIALSSWALVSRGPRAAWGAMAIVGVSLALGPTFTIGGVRYPGVPMPYDLLVLFPGFTFAGIPSRFIWLAVLATAVLSGWTLTRLAGKGSLGTTLAIALTACSLIENWPHPFPLTRVTVPNVVREWALTQESFSVVDTAGFAAPLWRQMIHQRPMVGGFVTRVPSDRLQRLTGDLVIRTFFPPPLGPPVQHALPFSPAAARERLRELRVKFVIVGDRWDYAPRAFGLAERYRGEGLAIYEVPQYIDAPSITR